MNKTAFVYFMSNTYNNVLYVGVTNNLVRRVAEHKAKVNKGFAYKYNVDKLVYFESIHSINDAIAREKQIKNWKREWKNELVNKDNPDWKDLSDSIGVTNEVIEAAKEHYKEIAGQARNDSPQVSNDGTQDRSVLDTETHNSTCHSVPDTETHNSTCHSVPDT